MINHKYKFVFIHIPKTGGRSIEKYLLDKNIHSDDLVDKFSDNTIINPHLTINDYINIYGDEILSYFWFCIVRNPFDRIVSEYFYSFTKKLTSSSFEDFVKNFEFESKTYKNHELKQTDFIKNNKKQFDFIGRFENLEESFHKIADRMLDFDKRNFPHENKSKGKSHYREYFSPPTYNLINEYYGEDILNFKYEF
jgi:hypothetical protein